MAEPYVAIVRFAHDVVLVDGSVIVDAHVPIDVHTAIDVHVGTAIDVHMGTPIDVRACMAATVMPTTVVTSSMTFTVAFADATTPSPSAAVTERMRQSFFSIFVL